MKKFANNLSFRDLKILDISGCLDVNNDILEPLAQVIYKNENLKVLNISKLRLGRF